MTDTEDRPLWWLSFADPDLPEGSQFLGVAVVAARDAADAVTITHLRNINPGGGIQVAGPLPAGSIAAEWRNRLLSKAEAGAVPATA